MMCKTFEELEKHMLDGQKLQGPPTAADVCQYLEQKAANDEGYEAFDLSVLLMMILGAQDEKIVMLLYCRSDWMSSFTSPWICHKL